MKIPLTVLEYLVFTHAIDGHFFWQEERELLHHNRNKFMRTLWPSLLYNRGFSNDDGYGEETVTSINTYAIVTIYDCSIRVRIL